MYTPITDDRFVIEAIRRIRPKNKVGLEETHRPAPAENVIAALQPHILPAPLFTKAIKKLLRENHLTIEARLIEHRPGTPTNDCYQVRGLIRSLPTGLVLNRKRKCFSILGKPMRQNWIGTILKRPDVDQDHFLELEFLYFSVTEDGLIKRLAEAKSVSALSRPALPERCR